MGFRINTKSYYIIEMMLIGNLCGSGQRFSNKSNIPTEKEIVFAKIAIKR